MAKREKSVEALLARSTRDLAAIEEEYEASLRAKSVSDDLRIDIKNLCENLRSVLDYLARDIRESHCPGANPKERFYFPILPNRRQFEAQMHLWYPGLDASNRELWDYLETVQLYHDDYLWLGQLNRVNNENKHGDLVEQMRVQTERVTVSTAEGGKVSWNREGVRFGSGVSIGGVPVDPATQLPVPHPSQRVERITWVDFRFQDIDVSAIGLLRQAVQGIEGIANGVLGKF